LIEKPYRSEITANIFLISKDIFIHWKYRYLNTAIYSLYLSQRCRLSFIVSDLNEFGIGLLSVGSLLSILTLYLVVDACHNILCQKDSAFYKANAITILSVYPVASVCSLTAIAIPRWKVNKNLKNIPLLLQLTITRSYAWCWRNKMAKVSLNLRLWEIPVFLFLVKFTMTMTLSFDFRSRGQLLSEAVTQIFLTISLYRLYLLLLHVGRRKIRETPILMLRVGPCCCWPCLPFPNLQMTEANLSWLGILALQLPIVQVKSIFPSFFSHHASITVPFVRNNYYNSSRFIEISRNRSMSPVTLHLSLLPSLSTIDSRNVNAR